MEAADAHDIVVVSCRSTWKWIVLVQIGAAERTDIVMICSLCVIAIRDCERVCWD